MSNNSNPITYQGITYPSEKAMCEALNFNYKLYNSRKRRGMTLEEIFNATVGDLKGNKCVYQGMTYPSEKAMCKALDFSYATYLSRKKKGMTIEQIVNTPIGKLQGNSNQCTYQGITYSSEKEMCKALDFPYGTYFSRKKKNMTLEEIFNTPLNSNNPVKSNQITYQGITYSSEKEMCKALDFPYGTYFSRKKKNMTLEEIFNTPISNKYEYQGVFYANEKEMCKALNFPYYTYLRRKKKGMSTKDIFNTPLKSNNQVTYQGITYSSEREMCKALGFSYRTYWTRKKKNMTLKEIFNIPSGELIGNKCTYQGVTYFNEKTMCKELKFNYNTYLARKRNGWTVEEALTVPINMSLGEYKIKESLERRQIKYKYNKTLKTIFKEFKLNIPWEEFLDILYNELISKGITIWSKETIGRLKPDFVLYKDENNKIIGIIEFDGEQHFGLIEYFFKTIQQFIYRCDCDTVKNKFFEFMSLPLLRIRYDQVDLIEPILDDFLAHPEEYISKKHNPYLTEEEYWSKLKNTLKNLDNNDDLGYNPS